MTTLWRKFGKSVISNRHLCTMLIACVLLCADDKMANISLDVHTFIAQNLPKYRFQSSLDCTFISLTTLHRLTCVHTKLFPTVKRRTCIHVLQHYSRNSQTCHFLSVQQVTLGRPRTKGNANKDLAHSFCGFLPNPFIQHLFLCPTSQERE